MRKPAFETAKSTDLAPSRDELNLAEFPFCLLTDRTYRGRNSITIEREIQVLLKKIRAQFRKQVDGRRINRRALVALALRRLIDTWDEGAERALLRSL